MTILNIVEPTPANLVTAQADPPFNVLYRGPPGAACSIACSDITPGGIGLGIGTKKAMDQMRRRREEFMTMSRVEEVAPTPDSPSREEGMLKQVHIHRIN